jgi:hypothetical protein
MVRVRVADPSHVDALLTPKEYEDFVQADAE